MTYLGYIFVPIGIAGLAFSKQWLYRLFVFWTLFSASSVLNIGDEGTGSAVQVWMLLGALWLMRFVIDGVQDSRFHLDGRILQPSLWLLAFLAAATLSLLMPLYINGGLMIASPLLSEVSETPLFLTAHNITQWLYLVFDICIAIGVAHLNMDAGGRHETEKILLASCAAISAWGMLQFFCNVTGLSYPAYIFNNSGSLSGKGFEELLGDEGVGRISSAALEPSILGQGLAALLPLTLPAWLRKGCVFSVSIDRIISLLMILVLMLSTSTTSYLGLLLLAVLLLPVLVRTRMISVARAVRVAITTTAIVVAFFAVLIATTPFLSTMFDLIFLQKSSSGSALERMMTIQLAFGYFLKYPVLGIGWGSATSHDLIVLLLSNVGIIGALVFCVAMLLPVCANWQFLSPLESKASMSRTAWFMGLSLFLLTLLINGFPISLGTFWVVLGMAIATSWSGESTANVLSLAEPR